MKKIAFLFIFSSLLNAQTKKDTVKVNEIEEVVIKNYQSLNGIGYIKDNNGIIYSGKKTEVIFIDSLDANKAINNTRQILGRIPGLNIVETESSGFTANGIATRGLNPSQSIEMNTRQNGYNISADVFGYNESYYLPPMEAVNRIDMVRGAASLQFGSQFGGMVNYILNDAPSTNKLEVKTSQTIGSFNMFNSFNSIGYKKDKLGIYSFLQYRNLDGYRANSNQWQLSGYGKINYQFKPNLNAGIEYTFLRNKIRMPGGLTDSLFNANPRISTRSRNWLKSPWNIITSYLNYNTAKDSILTAKVSYLFSERSLVWRNEDGGPEAVDNIDPTTGDFVNREVGREFMKNITSEIRFSSKYKLGNQQSSFASGIRASYGWFTRKGGGEGTTGSDFDLTISNNWEYNLDFTTTNFAPFLENMFKLTSKWSVTPGVRFEIVNNTMKGRKVNEGDLQNVNSKKLRRFLLMGIGTEYKLNATSNIYANISQAYRPIDYSQLEPFGISSKIDSKLKDSDGFNSDLGIRGTYKGYFNYDISLFYLRYNNRIGVVLATDPVTGDYYSLRKNVSDSEHKGIESYLELNILKMLNATSKHNISVFNSLSIIDAKYVNGEYKGNRVETANKYINRLGIIYATSTISSTLQFNYVGDAFGDATNVKKSENPIAGYLPSYRVVDFSTSYQIKNSSIKFGCTNIFNTDYFTRRTDEYPGPGIIPAVGRSFYIGFSAKF